MISAELDAGVGTWLEFVCPILMKNHEVTLLTSKNSTRKINCNKIIKLNSWNFPKNYYYMPKLKSLIKNNFFENFDIIQVHGFSSFAADYLLYKKKNIQTPIIFSPHGGLQPHPNLSILRKIHDKFMLRFDWNSFDRITAINPTEKRRLIELNFDENKIDVVYNGGGNHEKILPKIKMDKKIILYIGRFDKSKNIDLLIDAFSLCDISNSELIIAGPDYGALKDLKQKIQTMNLESKVTIISKFLKDEKYTLLSQSALFVHPSLTDVFAITLIEAAQAGVPCVAFDVTGNNEIIEDEVTGLLVKEKTSESLSKAMKKILTDELLAENISKAGKIKIPSKFNWENTAKSLEQTFNMALHIS